MIGRVASQHPSVGRREPAAWFAGRLATGLAEVRQDAAALDEPGWWAVVLTYEGELVAARFTEVRPSPPPRACWPGVAEGAWTTSTTRDAYVDGVEEIRRRIARGDVYQANLCRILTAPLPDGA